MYPSFYRRRRKGREEAVALPRAVTIEKRGGTPPSFYRRRRKGREEGVAPPRIVAVE